MFDCNVCGKRYYSRNGLGYHVSKWHRVEKIPKAKNHMCYCTTCGKAFLDVYEMYICTDCVFACVDCGKPNRSHAALQFHRRWDLDKCPSPGPYVFCVCNLCSRAFIHRKYLVFCVECSKTWETG